MVIESTTCDAIVNNLAIVPNGSSQDVFIYYNCLSVSFTLLKHQLNICSHSRLKGKRISATEFLLVLIKASRKTEVKINVTNNSISSATPLCLPLL